MDDKENQFYGWYDRTTGEITQNRDVARFLMDTGNDLELLFTAPVPEEASHDDDMEVQ